MKKKILSQLMILSFAFAGLFLVVSNVLAGNMEFEIGHGNSGNCTSETWCNQGFGDFGTHTGEILCCQTARFRGKAKL